MRIWADEDGGGGTSRKNRVQACAHHRRRRSFASGSSTHLIPLYLHAPDLLEEGAATSQLTLQSASLQHAAVGKRCNSLTHSPQAL